MPGFIIGLGTGIILPPEKHHDLIVTDISDDKYCISWRTCNKFQKDKFLLDDGQRIILLEGIIVNKRQLIDKYNASDWKDCVRIMYDSRKETFYNEFRGSFCGCVFERDSDRWLFFTDQIGDKQVLYGTTPKGIIIGTEISYLVETLKENGVSPTLNRDAAYMDLTLGYVIEDNTLFSEIRKLTAGHYLLVKDGKCQEVEYHRFSNKPSEMTVEEAIEGLDKLFRNAVQLDFEKDREYGYKHWATLSGGLDSRMTVWVAHELGYKNQLNLTFSQSNYADFKIAQQIATDLRHEFLFKSLDNGICIYDLDDITEISGGSACFFGISHTRSLFDKLDYSNYGIVHTGELGDVIIGSYQKSCMDYGIPPAIEDGAYSTELIDRLKGYSFHYPYENAEIYMMYNRGFGFVGQGKLGYDHNQTENLSPFCNVDFMEFCFRIPLKYRFRHKIYIDWILQKYPMAANYIWEGLGGLIRPIDNEPKNKRTMTIFGFTVPHFKDPDFPEYIKGFSLRRLGLRKKVKKANDGHTFRLATQNNMNPVDYWYANNPELKSFMDNYWNENRDLVKDPQLKEDMRYLYEDCVAVYDKMQVLTVLSAIKKYL